MIAGRESRPRWLAVCVLGLGHGIGDFNAGLLLALLGVQSGSDLVIAYLLYNVLAFLGQPFAGLITDRVGGHLRWFVFGGVLSAASLTLVGFRPELAVTCAGLASAFYHSAGGAAAWELGGRRALAAGCFAAPGVLGLAVGLAMGNFAAAPLLWLGGVAMASTLVAVLVLTRNWRRDPTVESQQPWRVRNIVGGVLGWVVLLAIAARSFAWSMGQSAIFPPNDAIWLALSAAVGKYVAAFLADRLGAGLVTWVSLLTAAVLLIAGRSSPAFFFPAVTALQAGTAPMMALVLQAWPRHPAFGSGLAQGLAVAIGGAPLLVLGRGGSFPLFVSVAALLLASLVMAMATRRKVPAVDGLASTIVSES
jgi:MFS transporter, FSR family, fosmidomycin resistance protein